MPCRSTFHLSLVATAAVLLGPSLLAGQATVTAAEPASVPGFRDHIVQVEGGWIDWTNGYIYADGRGRARSTSPQQRLMAMRTAELVAARNALAIASGIPLGADGNSQAGRGVRWHLHGVVSGHRTVRADWLPRARPPQARVTLQVPLWEADGTGSISHRAQLARRQPTRERLIILSKPDVVEAVARLNSEKIAVVLDARGLEVVECLFPVVVDTCGRVLYDPTAIPMSASRSMPPVQYVRADTSPAQPGAPVNRAQAANCFPRHDFVVRVRATSGGQGTELIVNAEDAEEIARSPDAVAALQAARVLVAVGPPPEAANCND